jgi:translation initiation factor 2 alpha subunit (eIF-2alpha)
MPGQRRKGKKNVNFWEWETNVDRLQEHADERGISLSELLQELTEKLLSKNGKQYKAHEGDE